MFLGMKIDKAVGDSAGSPRIKSGPSNYAQKFKIFRLYPEGRRKWAVL